MCSCAERYGRGREASMRPRLSHGEIARHEAVRRDPTHRAMIRLGSHMDMHEHAF